MSMCQGAQGKDKDVGEYKRSFCGRSDREAETGTIVILMSALMKKYRDTPMGLADALLIAVAESRTFRQISTVGRDFYIYRLADGTALEVIR